MHCSIKKFGLKHYRELITPYHNPCYSEIDAMPQPTMLFAINMVMLRELFIERRWLAALAGEGEEQLAERVNNILSVLITIWLEKVEYEWATILLGDNSLLLRDFLFITCCWLFGSVRIIFRNTGRNMQQSSLFYFFQLFSSITILFLSLLLLFYPHAFATNMNQSTRHLGTLFFYFVSLSQSLLLLACCYLRQRD